MPTPSQRKPLVPRAPRQPLHQSTAIIDLRILQWNAYSLRARVGELRHRISEMRKPPTIICVQETWLRPTIDLEIPGYTCVRHDRTTGEMGGGVATFVKTGVAFSKINTTDVPESITISIDGLPEKIKITNVYHPQSQTGDPLLPDTYSC